MQFTPKIGRNARCWCGSGKKFKRCHLDRESQVPLGKQEVLERTTKVFDRGRCLHPSAGPSTCSGEIISSHTIQRGGGLTRIASRGHVYSLTRQGKRFDPSRWDPDGKPHRVGIREASTFRGFCAKHDNELFLPLERKPFEGALEQIALLAYRALCYELSMKESALGVMDIQRELDKGRPLEFQVLFQEAASLRETGLRRAIKELSRLRKSYEEVVFREATGKLGYFIAFFDECPAAMCSGIAQATHDFRGKRIATLSPNSPADWMTLSLIATDGGGAAVFSWPIDHSKSEWVVSTLSELSDTDLPHAIVRFAFEFFENTYSSPTWWDGLEQEVQIRLNVRQLREIIGPLGENEYPRPDSCLLDDDVRAATWTVRSRLSSLPGQRRLGT